MSTDAWLNQGGQFYDRRQRREHKNAQQRPKPAPRDDGCTCHTGPRVTATWRGPKSTLSVAIEHFGYCPIPDTPLDPDLYSRR